MKRNHVDAGNHHEEGSTLVVVGLMLPILIAVAGLAFDLGNMEVGRGQAQAAADAAALAGARELFSQNGSTAATNAAQDSATQNGFKNGVNSVTVTVNTPPKSGPNSGNSSAVEVIISKVETTFFMSVIGSPTTTIQARAVGSLGGSNVCVQTTGAVGEGLDIDGGFILTAPNCTIYINSTNTGPAGSNGDQSITTHGGNCSGGGGTSGSNYTNPTGTPLTVVSSLTTAAAYYNQGVCIAASSSGPIMKPTFGATAMPDMLGYLAQPSSSAISACDQYNAASVSKNPPLTITGTQTLYPGSYCGGLWIKTGANVTLTAGTYILNGGNTEGGNTRTSLEIDGGATVTGSGVTFFNTGSTTPCSPTSCKTSPGTDYAQWAPILICSAHLAGPGPSCPNPGPGKSSEATVTLSAPTSGTYAGVLFFDARTLLDGTAPCGGTNAQHETCAKTTNFMQTELGGPNQSFTGTFYFPTTQLNFEGGPNAATGTCSPFVGWILLWNIPGPFNTNGSGGGLTVSGNCNSIAGGSPLKGPTLGE